MVNIDAENLDGAFGALADPTRRAILRRLSQGPTSVGELAEPFDISLPAVSRHLRVLEGAGMVTRERRGRNHILSLEGHALDHAGAWIRQTLGFWEERLDALERFLEET